MEKTLHTRIWGLVFSKEGLLSEQARTSYIPRLDGTSQQRYQEFHSCILKICGEYGILQDAEHTSY
jgi:hypothetical protein